MASAEEHALNVLGAIIPNRRDLLEKAMHQLSASHFQERSHSALFAFLQRYSDQTSGAIMPRKFMDDLLRDKVQPGQAILYEELYDSLEAMQVPDAEFIWSVAQLREIAADKATGESLTEAMEILRSGKDLGRGEIVKGHVEARQRILEAFQEIDRDLSMQDAPEGDMRDEANEMLLDYAERKQQREAGTSQGIQFGISALDRKIGGMQPGELVLAAGYSSDGKSTLCAQTAWSAAVEQGKNVVFLTTETLRPQIRRKILARHSTLPQFGIPNGLNTRDLKSGTLSPEDEGKLKDVVRDLTKNPAYGRLYIAQVPRSATVASLDLRLTRIQRRFNIDLVVMDYLALLRTQRRNSKREELSEILVDAKLLAVNFDSGRGVPIMSPWQVSRDARTQAENLGMYTSRALSETAEATNSADLIVSLLAPTDNSDREADVTMQILKNRDGETANGLVVHVDYATSAFSSRSLGLESMGGVSRAGGGSDEYSFEGLISD